MSIDTVYQENRALEYEIERQAKRIEEAERLIQHAVQIMTPEQVGQWRGVRTWQEFDGTKGGEDE